MAYEELIMSKIRQIAAILVADIVGCNRLEGTDGDRSSTRLSARVIKRTEDGSRSKSRFIMALVVAALLPPPIGAFAASPEDAYLAARDHYIASFRPTASAKEV